MEYLVNPHGFCLALLDHLNFCGRDLVRHPTENQSTDGSTAQQAAARPTRGANRSARRRIDKALPLAEPVQQAGEVGVAAAPVDLREAELEPAERAAYRDVGQAEVDAAAEGFFAEALADGDEGGVDLGHLPVDPGLGAFGVGAAGPGVFQAGGNAGVQNAVGQCFPGLDFGALAAGGRNELADGRQRVEVLDDDAGVEHRLAAFHDQAGHLAERVGTADASAGRPDVFEDELVVELFFRHDDADLADVGAGEGSDQFHGVAR